MNKLVYAISLLLVLVVPVAFADHSEVIIIPATDSGAPGCEETADGCYLPNTVTVDVDGLVIMSNTDTAAHTFTAGTPDDGPSGQFDTGLLMAESSFEWSPDTVGEIPYFCMVHPWMIGNIIVDSDGTTPPSPDPIPECDCDNEDEINQLKKEIADLKLENKQLKNQINSLNDEIDSLKDQIVSMSGEFVEMISQLNEWFRAQLS